MKRILLIGGGGHCRSVIDTLRNKGVYEEIGIVDNGNICYKDVRVVGEDDDLKELYNSGWTDAFITVGSIGDTALRRHLYNIVKETGFVVPVIVDPTAIVASDVTISKGTFVGKGVIINSGSFVGECSIINTGAIVEHDCKIGDFAHISSGSVLCGQVEVGKNTHLGAGSVVRQLINIGEDTLIGAGSVVVTDIPHKVKAYGNPCRVVD